MDFATIFSLAIKYGPLLSGIWTAATSNEQLTAKLKEVAAPLATVLEGVGAQQFPKAAPQLHIVAGLIATYDPNYVKWIQAGVNQIMGTHLVVDGSYGSLTTAAVEALQAKYGLVVDGVVGLKTDGLIGALLAGFGVTAPKAA